MTVSRQIIAAFLVIFSPWPAWSGNTGPSGPLGGYQSSPSSFHHSPQNSSSTISPSRGPSNSARPFSPSTSQPSQRLSTSQNQTQSRSSQSSQMDNWNRTYNQRMNEFSARDQQIRNNPNLNSSQKSELRDLNQWQRNISSQIMMKNTPTPSHSPNQVRSDPTSIRHTTSRQTGPEIRQSSSPSGARSTQGADPWFRNFVHSRDQELRPYDNRLWNLATRRNSMPSNQYQAARDSIKAERQAVWDRYSREYDQHQLSERQKHSDQLEKMPFPTLPSTNPFEKSPRELYEGAKRALNPGEWYDSLKQTQNFFKEVLNQTPGDDIFLHFLREK